MKALFLLEPGDISLLPVANAPAPKEFDFEKHFYHGLTRKIWNEYRLRHEVVIRVLDTLSE